MSEKKKVLFVCTHNSCRSQMAEGLMNALLGAGYEASSAGTVSTRVNPDAIRTMSEIGIDISGHRSKVIDEFDVSIFDTVVTVCDSARDACPFVSGARRSVHRSFADPSAVEGTGEEIAAAFRKTRDEIRAWLVEFFR